MEFYTCLANVKFMIGPQGISWLLSSKQHLTAHIKEQETLLVVCFKTDLQKILSDILTEGKGFWRKCITPEANQMN